MPTAARAGLCTPAAIVETVVVTVETIDQKPAAAEPSNPSIEPALRIVARSTYSGNENGLPGTYVDLTILRAGW
jgi:hypothetical protein